MIKMKENAQQAQELSEQLRLGTEEAQRCGIIRLSLVAIGSIAGAPLWIPRRGILYYYSRLFFSGAERKE